MRIIQEFLGDYTREIYGRELIGHVPMSQKAIALALTKLEKEGVLKSKKRGTLKLYRLNPDYTEIKDVLIVAERIRKIEFFAKHRRLAHAFGGSDDRIVGIFGSYAKGRARADSDVDIFIIGPKRKKDYDKTGRTLGLDVSIKYFSPSAWEDLRKNRNPLAKGIIRSHVLLFGMERFVQAEWDHGKY